VLRRQQALLSLLGQIPFARKLQMRLNYSVGDMEQVWLAPLQLLVAVWRRPRGHASVMVRGEDTHPVLLDTSKHRIIEVQTR
jgi:hypothetical protein